MSEPLAVAYVEIRARGEHLDKDVRDFTERAAGNGGEAGGKTFSEKFTESAGKGLKNDEPKFSKLLEGNGSKAGDGFSTGFARALKKGLPKGLVDGLGKGLLGGAKLGGMAAAVAPLMSTLSGVAGAAVALSGAAGLLPGVFLAGGVAAGALKVGLSGVSDAIKNSGDPKKYAVALATLSPAARAFTKAVVGLKPELSSLKKEVQNGLFKGLAGEVRPIGERYLPILRTGLTGVSTSFGHAASSAASFLNNARPAGQVKSIFHDIGGAVEHLSGVFKPVTAAFLDISEVGSSFLPGLTKGLSGAAQDLGTFIGQAKESGKLHDFFAGGIEAVKELGSTLGSVGRIVSGVFKAAGGANKDGLSGFATVLKDIADQVNTPAFQGGLEQVFSGLGKASQSIGDALPSVAQALGDLAPALATVAGSSGVALGSVLKVAASAATSLAPAITAVADGVSTLAPFLGPLAAELYVAAKAQALLNGALDANPIGLVVVGIAAFSVAVVAAYEHSEKFRAVVQYVFKANADAILGSISKIIGAFASFFGVLAHLPGKVGTAFRSAQASALKAKKGVDNLRHSIDSLKSKSVNVSVKTTYWSLYKPGHEPGTYGNGLGVLKRAAGGPVAGGQTYLVGEEGPELFQATSSGMILNAGATKKAAAGMNDLTARSTSTTTTPAGAPGPARLDRDDLDYLLRGFAKAMQQQPVVLNTGAVAGAVYREGGRF